MYTSLPGETLIKMYNTDVNDFIRLYNPQVGRGADDGLVFYKSSYKRQRGAGLGAVFGAIARKLIPIARNILWPAAKKYVIPHASLAAKQLAGDVLSGRNVKESIKHRGQDALKGIGDSIATQSGSGRKRKRKSKKRKTAAKRTTRSKKVKLSKALTLF